ncbi:MAG: hypothetical protein ABIL09_04515 [Gemmatimonadota bacterium]
MEALLKPSTDTILPDEVHTSLWERIAQRLERGDALITSRDFREAVEAEYQSLTGAAATPALRVLFQEAIDSFNRDHPEHYVARGVQNGVTRAFQTGVFRLSWDVVQIQSAGARSVARFKSRDRVMGLLRAVRVPPGLIDEGACVRHAIDVVSGRKEPLVKRPAREPLSPPSQATPAPTEVGEEARAAIRDGLVERGEADARLVAENQVRAEIEREQIKAAGQHVDSYVKQGYITGEEGETVRQLHEIEQRVARGEIDESEGIRLRNSLLSPDARRELERKLKGAVDYSVRFLQVFEALTRISPSSDEALRFLIHHKRILDEEQAAAARQRAGTELMEDGELLTQVCEIMDRRDQEIRMISVLLPPYSYIAKRGNERIGNLVIEEDFVDQLRGTSPEEMSERLNSPDPEVRVRPAADMQCLIAIVNQLIKPTPWRKEVRLLRVQQTIEQFYHESDNVEEARKQAEGFLKRRLRRMFRDLTSEERTEIEGRGAAMIDAVERKVLAEREAADREKAQASRAGGDGQEGDEGEDLSEDEIRRGAQIGRVEVRVAGQMRRIPQKIILDPDDDSRYVVARRNPDSGALEPVVRRGARRVVERDRDGIWHPTS